MTIPHCAPGSLNEIAVRYKALRNHRTNGRGKPLPYEDAVLNEGQASFLEQSSSMPEMRPMKMSVQTSKPTVFGFVPL